MSLQKLTNDSQASIEPLYSAFLPACARKFSLNERGSKTDRVGPNVIVGEGSVGASQRQRTQWMMGSDLLETSELVGRGRIRLVDFHVFQHRVVGEPVRHVCGGEDHRHPLTVLLGFQKQSVSGSPGRVLRESSMAIAAIRLIEILVVTYRVYTERGEGLAHLACAPFEREKFFRTLCSYP